MGEKWNEKGKWGIADQVYLHLGGNLMSPCILLSPKSCSADCHLPLTAAASIINLKTLSLHCIWAPLLPFPAESRGSPEQGLCRGRRVWSVPWHREQGLPLAPGKVPGWCHAAQALGTAGGSWKSWTQIPVFLWWELLLVEIHLPAEICIFPGAFVLLYIQALYWKCSLAMRLLIFVLEWNEHIQGSLTPHTLYTARGGKAKKPQNTLWVNLHGDSKYFRLILSYAV